MVAEGVMALFFVPIIIAPLTFFMVVLAYEIVRSLARVITG